MTQYLGVDKQDIIDSLKTAEAFLRGLNLGPATAEALDAWVAKRQPYTRLQAAASVPALAAVVQELLVDSPFLRKRDTLLFHAVTGTPEALEVLGKLNAWGGLSGRVFQDYRPTDAEEGAYLYGAYAQAIAAQSGAFLTPAQEEGLKKSFLAQDLGPRNDLLDSFRARAGISDEKIRDVYSKISPARNPRTSYGLVLDAIETLELRSDIEENPLMERLLEALEPFALNGEVTTHVTYDIPAPPAVRIGFLTRDWQNDRIQGLAFTATRNVARAVANALPERKVIDSEGQVIAPQKAAPKPKRGPQP